MSTFYPNGSTKLKMITFDISDLKGRAVVALNDYLNGNVWDCLHVPFP